MRIVLISEVFAKGMGYLENMLPKHLARQGAQVDVLASSLPPDYSQNPERQSYRDFAHRIEPGSVESVDGFRVHVMRHTMMLGHPRLLGLSEKLNELQPQIVQTMTPIGWIAIDSALNQLRLGYRLFSGCHYHASVFPLAQAQTTVLHPARWKCFVQRGLHGRVLSWVTDKYYAISPDCAEVATRFFGVPKSKLEVSPLGVDIDVFHPVSDQKEQTARATLRRSLGYRDDEIVCVYSGRLSEEKNPLLLARAVDELGSAGEPFRGLFIGNGAQSREIASCRGCVIRPFMPITELGSFYRAADIGVWPTQESTSMLDAIACGLPLIANDTVKALERLTRSGLQYRLGDLQDLVRTLSELRDIATRQRLGAEGARRMKEECSWRAVAQRRMSDYSAATEVGDFPTSAIPVQLSSHPKAGATQIPDLE
jgi:glycosyltransferase involved in cell wall biosynthesis